MPYSSIVSGIIQWLIILIFVGIGFAIGAIRGFKKSYYYTLTNFILTLVVLIFISVVSIRMVFPTAGDLLNFTNQYFQLDENIISYIENPNISPILFAIIDVVIKVVLFIIIFPILKIVVNFLILKPIWYVLLRRRKSKFHVQLRRQYGVELVRYRPTMISRISGGVLGAFRGLFTVFILILPFIILGGITEDVSTINSTIKGDNNSPEALISSQLASNNNLNLPFESDIIGEVISGLKGFNQYGPGRFVRKIKNDNGTLDVSLFDTLFGGDIVTKDDNGEVQKVKLRLAREFSIYGNIATTIYDRGYLSNFDYKEINYEDDYETIDYIIKALGKSQIINLALPIGIDILDAEGIIDEQLGFNIKEVNGSDLTYQNIKNINWNDEFTTLSGIIGNVLLVGNVGEIMNLASSPDTLLKSSIEDKERILDVLDAMTNLQVLVAGQIGVEFALRNESLLNQIKWHDEPEAYLRERVQFIFANYQYFNQELKVVHKTLKDVFNEDFSDYDFTTIYKNNKINYDQILSDDTKDIFIKTLGNVINLELFQNGLPVAIDYGAYAGPMDISEAARDKIDQIVDDINYEDELEHLDGVYANIIKLGLSSLLTNQSALVNEIDMVLQKEESFAAVKDIVEIVFIQSEFVGEVLEYGVRTAARQFVKDETIRDIILSIDEIEDFSYGQEILTAISLAEDVYKVSDMVTVITMVQNKDYFGLASELSYLGNENYYEFKQTLLNFQIIDHLDNDLIVELSNKYAPAQVKDYLFIPEEANGTTIKGDLKMIIDLGFEVATQVRINQVKNTNGLSNIDLNKLIDPEALSEILVFDEVKHEHSILLHSAVNLFKTKQVNVPQYGVVSFSPKYRNLDANSPEWIAEVNILIGGLLDVVGGIGASDNFTLTINNAKGLTDLENIPVDLLYDLEASGSINKIGQSYNVRYNVTEVMTSETTNDLLAERLSNIFGKEIKEINLTLEEEWLDEDGLYKNSELKGLIKSLKVLDVRSISGLTNALIDKVFDLANTPNDLDTFFDSNYLRVMSSRFLLSNTVKEMLATSAQIDKNDLTFNIVERETEREDSGNLTKEEVKNIFIAFNALGIKDPDNIEIDNNTLKELDQPELDKVLASNYFYQIMDLTMKAQLTVPVEALEDDGKYEGLIKKSEISSLVEALKILDIDDDIDASNIKVSQLEALIALESFIVDKLVSDEVINVVDVPEASKNLSGNVTNAELENLILAIKAISDEEDPFLNDLDMANTTISTALFDELLAIGDSPIINRLISEGIISAFSNNDDEDILLGLTENSGKDITRVEIVKLNETLKALGINEITDNINVDDITINHLINVTDTNNHNISTIVYRVLSNSTRTALGNDDTEIALSNDGKYLELVELNKVFQGVEALGVVKVSDIHTLNFMALVFVNIVDADSKDSLIIRRLISKELIANDNIVTDGFVEGAGNSEVVKKDDLTDFIVAASTLDNINTIQDLVDELANPNPFTIMAWTTTNAYNESAILKASIDKKIADLGL